ncbi:TPA: prepilin-type N-terminal cleavage/methylation domain-containing protein [Vibrio cholerae]|nr:prepilin-type N-terminal cleavage/methylation domain-containing protein [Vibrio cholerae]EGR4251838.1 prepilin-type N-terminal cleavage/methylation domain-containing protein [Vibrio cholerae]EKG0011901.1 prepilin-type N-terminal cleavage/methylation domain-containing protein [Vibrio cholerae]ELE2132706.1 prepilin-type N-terminal cleavage/methylation domain-containing protein [Vibrio cholerae]
MKAYKNKQQQGFTLIELMIVVAIIGVLSAIAVPAYKDYVTKSEVASAVASLKSIITPAELYYQEYGTFPSSDTELQKVGVGSNAIKNGTLDFSVSSAIKLVFASPSGASATVTRDGSTGWKCAVAGLTNGDNAPKGCPQEANP